MPKGGATWHSPRRYMEKHLTADGPLRSTWMAHFRQAYQGRLIPAVRRPAVFGEGGDRWREGESKGKRA